MQKTNVSAGFMSFLGQNSQAIEDVKKAELRTGNVPVPVGAEGTCIVTDFKFDQSKDKLQPDQTTKLGTPFCGLKCKVIGGDHQGKTIQKTYWFSDSANMSSAGRFEMFLNDLVRMGLPEETKKGFTHPQELGDFFLRDGVTLHWKCVEDNYAKQDDNKAIRFSATESIVDDSSSLVPSSTIKAEEKRVRYNEQNWIVTEEVGDKYIMRLVDDSTVEKVVAKALCS